MRGHRDELPAGRVERPVVARPRRSKHNARKCVEYVGTQECHFDSQAEWKYALWLERERKAGRVDQWVHHPGRVTLYGLQGKPVGTMEPDFAVWYPKMPMWVRHEFHEVKGMPTAAWRIKRALFEQEHGSQYPYVVIDAGHVDPPLLFDDRRKRKAAKKRERALKPVAKKRGRK